jgi:hypothetical protein
MPSACRFPPPWLIEEHNNACFIVRDSTGQALAYVYFEDEPGRRSAAKLLTKDEARRMAANFAKLPELLRRPSVIQPSKSPAQFLVAKPLTSAPHWTGRAARHVRSPRKILITPSALY